MPKLSNKSCFSSFGQTHKEKAKKKDGVSQIREIGPKELGGRVGESSIKGKC